MKQLFYLDSLYCPNECDKIKPVTYETSWLTMWGPIGTYKFPANSNPCPFYNSPIRWDWAKKIVSTGSYEQYPGKDRGIVYIKNIHDTEDLIIIDYNSVKN